MEKIYNRIVGKFIIFSYSGKVEETDNRQAILLQSILPHKLSKKCN